jgi:hypothetical protein
MKEETRQLLKELAERYETHNFIVDDPVMFRVRRIEPGNRAFFICV